MLPLVVGTLLAVGALAFVLLPLFVTPRRAPAPARSSRDTAIPPESEAVAALREIEFDRATGKLSDNDYDELKSRYTERALAAMRSGAATTTPADAVEAAVMAFRARLRRCVRCGPRPEPDAAYCSSCGHFIPGMCESCGAAVAEAGATYCSSCGRRLAA